MLTLVISSSHPAAACSVYTCMACVAVDTYGQPQTSVPCTKQLLPKLPNLLLLQLCTPVALCFVQQLPVQSHLSRGACHHHTPLTASTA